MVMMTLCVMAVSAGTVPAADEDRVATLMEALRDDDVRWNAYRATSEIWNLDEPPIAALQAALDSDDAQQRQHAASLLWSFAEPSPWSGRERREALITRRLLEVTVEGLARDDDPGRGRSVVALRNAASGFRRLSRHADEARDLLEAGLKSRDSQQRLLCALALGFGGVHESAETAARVLLPHLRDNAIPEDAKWSVRALYGFGEPVRPSLLRALGGADRQQEELIRLLLLDLDRPPQTKAELEERARWNSVTKVVHDPAVEMQADRSMWWLWAIPE
jgi:hypothetical protein